MKTILRQQRLSSILTALAVVALGVVLVIWPDRSAAFLCQLLGGGLLVAGIVYMIGWLVGRTRAGSHAFLLLPGAVLAGIGVWLLARPDSVVVLIQYVSGAVLIFHGIIDLQGAVALMMGRAPRWWLDLLISLVTLSLGLLILVDPFGTFAVLVMMIGSALIYDGVSDLWLIARLSRFFRAVEQVVEDQQAIPTEGSVEDK